MTLNSFQTAVGRLLREHNDTNLLSTLELGEEERSYFEDLHDTAGFRLYAGIQRSWCIGRAAKAAPLTLSVLPDEQRRLFLDDWVSAGGGTRSFYEVEAESFFDFISRRLIDPSPELSLCEFERAAQRASMGVNSVPPTDFSALTNPVCCLRRGRYAAVVRLHVDPGALLESLQRNKPLPELSYEPLVVMFSPGISQLWSTPTADELALWQAVEEPTVIDSLLASGHSLETIKTSLARQTLEFVG